MSWQCLKSMANKLIQDYSKWGHHSVSSGIWFGKKNNIWITHFYLITIVNPLVNLSVNYCAEKSRALPIKRNIKFKLLNKVIWYFINRPQNQLKSKNEESVQLESLRNHSEYIDKLFYFLWGRSYVFTWINMNTLLVRLGTTLNNDYCDCDVRSQFYGHLPSIGSDSYQQPYNWVVFLCCVMHIDIIAHLGVSPWIWVSERAICTVVTVTTMQKAYLANMN